MRPPVAANSAYWFCCVMDVLSAISLPAAPSDRKGGWYWGDKEVGGQGSASGMLWPEKERWSRSISANINPLHNDNSVATFTLQHIDMYQQQPPRSCDPNDPIVIQKYHFDRKYLLGPFKDQVAKAVQLANVLNNLFLYNHRSDDLYKNTTYFALTQTLVDSDPKVKGCGIVFDVGQYPSTPHIASKSKFFPYSYRATKGATIVSELSSLYEPFNSTFFVNQKSKDPSKLVKNTPISSENSDLVRLGLEIKYQWNHTITVTESDGYWAQPYYDCFLNSWILQFSVPFYEVKSNGSAVFK